MTKFRDIHRRMDRIGGGKGGDDRPVPHVLRVRTLAGETIEQAHERFNAEYPNRPRGHNVLVIPARAANDAERELEARLFRDRQLALVSAARSERLATVKADQAAPRVPPKVWPTAPTIRPSSGPHLTWKPNA